MPSGKYNPGTAFSNNSGYGIRIDPFNPASIHFHGGLDFKAAVGTAIPAAATGVVWYSGENKSGGFGYTVVLKHVGADGNPYYTLYAHMTGANMPALGTTVSQGGTVGLVGSTGNSQGPHLHFSVLKGTTTVNNAAGGPMGFDARLEANSHDPDTFQNWSVTPFGSATPRKISSSGVVYQDVADMSGEGILAQTKTFLDGGHVIVTYEKDGVVDIGTEVVAATATVEVTAMSYQVNISNAVIRVLDGAAIQVTGDNNTVIAGAGTAVTVIGYGNDVDASGPNNKITIGGNGAGGTGALTNTVDANGADIEILGNSNVNVRGDDNDVTSGSNSNFGVYGDGSEVIAGSGCGVWVGGNGQNSTADDRITVHGPAASVNIVADSNANIYGSNMTINAGSRATFGAYGSGLTINAGANNGVWVGGNGQDSGSTAVDTVLGNPSHVTIVDNSHVTVKGDTVVDVGEFCRVNAVGAGADVYHEGTSSLWVGGNGINGVAINVHNPEGGDVGVANNSHIVAHGNGGTYVIGSNDRIYSHADNAEFVVNGDSTWVYDYGDNNIQEHYGFNDLAYSSGSNSDVFSWGNQQEINVASYNTHAYLYGESWSAWHVQSALVYYVSPGYFYPSGTHDLPKYQYGFAGAGDRVEATIRESDLPDLNVVQLAMKLDAKLMHNGSRFDHKVITWSIDADSPAYTGKLGAEEVDNVEAAFDAWSDASGLTFVQVRGGAPADIQIGWANLNHNETGIIGLTTTQRGEGGRVERATVRIEDKGTTALLNDVYAGTDATLTQVLMHEIGHALGLGVNNDPTSIQSYHLGATNASLNANDVVAIQRLYWDLTGSGPFVSPNARAAILELAAFAPSEGADGVTRGAALALRGRKQDSELLADDVVLTGAIDSVALGGLGFEFRL